MGKVNITEILIKRGTTSQVAGYTGPLGELVMDTTANLVYVQDGRTAGGHIVGGGGASPGASSYIGIGAAPQGKVALSATLVGTPTLHTVFGEGLTGAITTIPQIYSFYDLEGSVILPPGAYAAIYTSTASGAASLAASFQWEEIPL